ncbi:hypothetical protein [Kribbella italica]|uniref:Minor tail protein n=1 Tax=Kribbella italica TaxID=1540520 RepID=A0A7W9JAP6_9ACTN|nr:hypothetical protein [Kribbella italica]MBB5838716.1 hypothetical protein [Kribbella italica]
MALRQGTVVAWDADTGANTISVAGGTLVNIPVLIGETVVLDEGDVVALLTTGDRWFLLGKVKDPGDPGTVPTWPNDILALDASMTSVTTVTIPAVQADADAAAAAAAQAALDAATAQAAADALRVALEAAEAAVGAVEAAVATLTGTTLPALQSDLGDLATAVANAQSDVDAILPITETDISNDAITTPKIAANAITAAHLAADSVTASKLAANAVTAGKIAAGTIVAADISSGAITTAKIAAGAVTATEIAAGAITAAKLSADAIDGKTITGATFLTAGGTSARWELSSTNSNKLIGRPASNVNNPQPGVIMVDSTSIGASGWMYETRITAPYSAVSGGDTNNPLLRISTHEGTGRSAVEAVGEQGALGSPAGTLGLYWDDDTGALDLVAPGALSANGARVLTAGNTRVATGNVLTGSGATKQDIAVSFPGGRFTAAPTVAVTARTSADVVTQVAVSGESSTGFTLHFKRNPGVATNVGWIAIQIV